MSILIRDSLCRLCAQSRTPLFLISKEIVYQIALTLDVHIKSESDDELPTKICNSCLANVSICWNILKQVHSAQNLLNDLFKTEDNVETIIITSKEVTDTEPQISDYGDTKMECNDINNADITTVEDNIQAECLDNVEYYLEDDCRYVGNSEKKMFQLEYEYQFVKNEKLQYLEYVEDGEPQYCENREEYQCATEEVAQVIEEKEVQDKKKIEQNTNSNFYGDKLQKIELEEPKNIIIKNPLLKVEKRIVTYDYPTIKLKNDVHAVYAIESNTKYKIDSSEKCAKIKKIYPCICYVCDQSFESGEDLQYHVNEHKLQKPFKCYLCRFRFSDLPYWHSHLRKIHGVVFEMVRKNMLPISKQGTNLDAEAHVPINTIEIIKII